MIRSDLQIQKFYLTEEEFQSQKTWFTTSVQRPTQLTIRQRLINKRREKGFTLKIEYDFSDLF